MMVQAGLDEKWWPEAMNCFCFLRNVVLALEGGDTAYKKRFGSDFTGPLIPFGAMVKYHPITQKDKGRVHQMSDKLLPGVFLGYSQQSGGGWSGDLLLCDWEQLAAADSCNEVLVKRFAHQ